MSGEHAGYGCADYQLEGGAEVVKRAREIMEQLRGIGVRADIDERENYRPGWKFNHWEVRECR